MTDREQPMGQVTDDGGRWRLRYERSLRHPKKVWRAITESEHLEHWMPMDIVGERAQGAAIDLPFWPAQVERYSIEDPLLHGTIRCLGSTLGVRVDLEHRHSRGGERTDRRGHAPAPHDVARRHRLRTVEHRRRLPRLSGPAGRAALHRPRLGGGRRARRRGGKSGTAGSSLRTERAGPGAARGPCPALWIGPHFIRAKGGAAQDSGGRTTVGGRRRTEWCTGTERTGRAAAAARVVQRWRARRPDGDAARGGSRSTDAGSRCVHATPSSCCAERAGDLARRRRAPSHPVRLARAVAAAERDLARRPVDLVVSAGTAVAVPYFLAARRRGVTSLVGRDVQHGRRPGPVPPGCAPRWRPGRWCSVRTCSRTVLARCWSGSSADGLGRRHGRHGSLALRPPGRALPADLADEHDVFIQTGTSTGADPPLRARVRRRPEELRRADARRRRRGHPCRQHRPAGSSVTAGSRSPWPARRPGGRWATTTRSSTSARRRRRGRVVAVWDVARLARHASRRHAELVALRRRSSGPRAVPIPGRCADQLDELAAAGTATGPFHDHPTRRYDFAWTRLARRTGRAPGRRLQHRRVPRCARLDHRPRRASVSTPDRRGDRGRRRAAGRPVVRTDRWGRLPFPADTFDSVTALDVLEHVPRRGANCCARSAGCCGPAACSSPRCRPRTASASSTPTTPSCGSPACTLRSTAPGSAGTGTVSASSTSTDGYRGDLAVERHDHTNYEPATFLALLDDVRVRPAGAVGLQPALAAVAPAVPARRPTTAPSGATA